MDNKKMLNSIKELISIKSVKEPPKAGKPFGEGIFRALNYFLELARSFGFKTVNYDNYIGEVVWGSGEAFAVLCHLDTVPASANWTYPPFEATIEQGRIYGRGAVDNKTPAIVCLYALKQLKDEGFIPSKTIKLIVGCDEESGWQCIEHYNKSAQMPEYGFSPDAAFPVIYAEKGIMHIECRFKTRGVSRLQGGSAVNMVCDYADMKCRIDDKNILECNLKCSADQTIYSTGKSAHGSTPEQGINALDEMVRYLELGSMIEEGAHAFLFGANPLKELSDQTGKLTMSVGKSRLEEDTAVFTVDIRYPASMQRADIEKLLDESGVEYKALSHKAPIYMPEQSNLVQTLLRIYNEETGESAKPVAIGGGTYARSLKRGVGFGPEFPGKTSTVHQDDEYIEIEDIYKIYQIYYRAIKELASLN